MKAKDYLQQVRKIDSLIRNKEAERAQWKAAAIGLNAVQLRERVQSSGDKQKMAGAVAIYSDIDREIDKYIVDLKKKKQEIISLIERLNEPEYDLLHKVYIQYLTLDEAADSRNRSKSWAISVHGIALKHVQDILDAQG